MKYKFFIICIFLVNILFSDTNTIDSLQSLITNAFGKDKIDLMLNLVDEYREIEEGKAIEICNDIIEYATRNNDEPGRSKAYKLLGDIYYDQRKNELSLQKYQESILIQLSLNDFDGLAYCYNAVGSLYLKSYHYEKALKNLLNSLYYYHELNNTTEISGTMNNIAIVYQETGDFDNALNYFNQSLELCRQNNKQKMISRVLANIGTVHNQMDQTEKALAYYNESLQLREELGDQSGIAQCYNNIGNIYSKSQDFRTALDFYLKALKLKREVGDKKAIIYPLVNLGNVYRPLGDYQKSLEFLTEALETAKQINAKELIRDSYLALSETYDAMQEHQKALKSFQLYSAFKDSLMNEEISTKVAKIQSNYETEKKEKEIDVYKLALDKQKFVRLWLFLGITILLILTLIILYFYRSKTKANLLLRNEINERNKIENELQKARNELELRVTERTNELAKTNLDLKAEVRERKATEEMYRKYEFIANTSREFMTLINHSYRYEAVNNSYCEAYKKDRNEIIGMTVADIWGKEQFETIIRKYMDSCFEGKEVRYQEWFVFSGNEKRYYDVAYYPYFRQNDKVTHIVVVTRDFTERKYLENQLLRSEHLAGIGELAAGIAHEIKNPIAIINSTAQYCRNKFKTSEDEIQELMEVFMETSNKINKTVNSLLEFARPQRSEMKKGDLLQVINKVKLLIEGKCSSQNVEIVYQAPERLPLILLDENQMDSLFLNLFLNALDAMPDGGRITLKIRNLKDVIYIYLSDTGKGISEIDMKKIFNPFFTTKKGGSGLGLSLVHQIIKFHKSKIHFNSVVGEGTQITIKIPLDDQFVDV